MKHFNSHRSAVPSRAAAIVGAALAAAVPAAAQTLDLNVHMEQSTLTVDITGGPAAGAVLLGIDFVTCDGDVDGDRATTALDVAAVQNAYGPVRSSQDKLYDLNNDGYINEDDVAEVQAGLGCSDPQSIPLPGCSTAVNLNPATLMSFTVMTDNAGNGVFTVPLPPGFDDRFYFQAVDPGSCGVTALKPFSALGEDVSTAPVSTLTAVVQTDFYQPQNQGLVRIESDLGARTFSKTAQAQTDGLLNASPGSVASIIMGETPATFSDSFGSPRRGFMVGLTEQIAMTEERLSTARIQNVFQPFAVDTTIGAANTIAPFHALYDIVLPYQVGYEPFDSQIAVLPTRAIMEDVLSYYDVGVDALENAEAAVLIRVSDKVDLNQGPSWQHGFGVMLKNFTGFSTQPYVATRYLSQVPGTDTGMAIAGVASFDRTKTGVQITGTLQAGDHLILLSRDRFQASTGSYITNPPSLVATAQSDSGGCGTPPPPATPPAVGGGTCVAGLPFIWAISDCVLTGGAPASSTQCATVGPFLLATSGGAAGFKIKKKIETSYKGSVNVGVQFEGVSVGVGQEITHTEGIETDITLEAGANGCGQNLAWYLYEKYCVTRYQIRYHTWEGWFPDWCAGCCIMVDVICKAGETITAEKCDRDC